MTDGQAIDIFACRTRTHMAIHGAVIGRPGKVWGHEFVSMEPEDTCVSYARCCGVLHSSRCDAPPTEGRQP